MNTARILGINASAIAALLLACGQSHADYVALTGNNTLDQLTPNGNYTTVGDKTFTFLSYSSATVASSAVGITALSGNSNAPVVPYGFQLSASFSTSGVSASTDVAVDFSVTSSDGPITSVNLSTNGTSTGSGVSNVSETVYQLSSNGGQGTYIGQIDVNGSGTATLLLGAGYTGLYITKDINTYTGSTGGSASLSIVGQTFTEPAAVPEPASIVMMGLGLGLVGAYAFACSQSRRKALIS